MENKVRNLDDWSIKIYSIFERDNSERSHKDVILFFYETIGRCFQLINKKQPEKLDDVLPILFKWFCILYHKKGTNQNKISDVLWNKFPGICPYCRNTVCNCKSKKKPIDIDYLIDLARKKMNQKPELIQDWQAHFQSIYPRNEDSDILLNISRLSEEIAELCEAFRKDYVRKDIPCIDMEFADVFTWIVGMANVIDKGSKIGLAYNFQEKIELFYSDGCPDCTEEREKYQIEYCVCSIKPKKLKLITDYDSEIKNDIGNIAVKVR